MSFTESDDEVITRRPIRKRASRLDSMEVTPTENTNKTFKLNPIVDTSPERTISTLGPGSSVDNSEGKRMGGGATVGANGRLPRKGRFLKGTTLMAEMKEARRSKQNKSPKKSSKSKIKEDKIKSKEEKDDSLSGLGLALLNVPDVGICSLSEETTAVRILSSPSQHKPVSKSKMKRGSRKKNKSSSSSPSDLSSPSRLIKGKISFRGTKTDEEYSDILSPEIAIQTYEGKTDPPVANPPGQKDASSLSSAVISPHINEDEPNIKILESWEKDVEPHSTVAPVLWALDHMKFILEKKIDWTTKARTIWSKWKSLSKNTHRHYLEMAKKNREVKESETSKVVSETNTANKVPANPNISSLNAVNSSDALPSTSNRSSPDIIHIMSNPFATHSNDALPPYPVLSVIGSNIEVNTDIPVEEFPGNASNATNTMSALITPQSFYNKANNEDINEAGLSATSSLPHDIRCAVDAVDNNMMLASTMKALLANPYLFPSILANSGMATQAQMDYLKRSSSTPLFNNDDPIGNHMAVTQPNFSLRDHVTGYPDPLLLHLLPSTASDSILSLPTSVQDSVPINNDLITSSQLGAITTVNKAWYPSLSSAGYTNSNRGAPFITNTSTYYNTMTSIPPPYFNGPHASSFITGSAPVNNITNESDQVLTASVTTKTSVPCPVTFPSIDAELSSIQYRSNPYYTNTRSTITTEVTPSSIPSTSGATGTQPYISPSILSPVSVQNVPTVTTIGNQISSSVAHSLPSKGPPKHAQRRTKSTSTSPSPTTKRKRVHSTGSTNLSKVALSTSSSNSVSSSTESLASSVSICTLATSQKSISPSNIIIPRSCPPPSTTSNARHNTDITDDSTVDSGTKLLEVSAEWKETLQKRMKELLQKQKDGRHSPPKPSQPSHYLPRKQRRRKMVQDSTNKLIRPPMKVMPPSILQGEFNSPESSPISPLETPWPQSSPPVIQQTEFQSKSSPGTPLIVEPNSHVLAQQHSPGPSPVMIPITPLPNSYANNPLMDALNYAELERQYRHSLYMLETQQEHVEELKKRLLQARMHQQMLFLQSEQYQRCARLLIKPANEYDIPISIPGYNPVVGDTSDTKQWSGTFDKPCTEGDNYYKTLMGSIS